MALLVLAQPSAAQTTKRVPQGRAEIQMSFAPLVKKSAPAVVNIFTRKIVSERQSSPLFNDPFFRRFFGYFFNIHSTFCGEHYCNGSRFSFNH